MITKMGFACSAEPFLVQNVNNNGESEGDLMNKIKLDEMYKKEIQIKRRPRYLEGDSRGDYEKHYMQNG